MERIRKGLKDLIDDEIESQNKLKDAMRGIGYGID